MRECVNMAQKKPARGMASYRLESSYFILAIALEELKQMPLP